MPKLNNSDIARIEAEYIDQPDYNKKCHVCGKELSGYIFTINNNPYCKDCYYEYYDDLDDF